MRSLCLGVCSLLALVGAAPAAQVTRPFTAEDMLKVATASVLDLTEDGTRVAVAVRTARGQRDHRPSALRRSDVRGAVDGRPRRLRHAQRARRQGRSRS